jgi:hypothetical protein
VTRTIVLRSLGKVQTMVEAIQDSDVGLGAPRLAVGAPKGAPLREIVIGHVEHEAQRLHGHSASSENRSVSSRKQAAIWGSEARDLPRP